MKKLLYSLACLGLFTLSGCDMNLEPIGSIPDAEALQTAADCRAFRNGFYNNLRRLSTGAYIYYTELQMDMFVGTQINGNRVGNLANGIVLSSDADIEAIWGGLYGGISDVNFFFKYAEPLRQDLFNQLTAEEEKGVQGDQALIQSLTQSVAEIDHYLAEAHFFRAFYYYWLLDHYCPKYSEYKDGLYGLPIVKSYFPTADKAYYEGRATLADTYAFIEQELDLALNGRQEPVTETVSNGMETVTWVPFEGLYAWEEIDSSDLKSMSAYVNSDIVKCLQARLALYKEDYATAREKALEVIGTGRYPLVRATMYAGIWTSDNGSEIIFRPISTASELGISSTGSGWISASEYRADYICTMPLSGTGMGYLYESANDARFGAFIGSRELVVEGAKYNSPVFVKYPGNKSLMQGGAINLMNMPKVFRSAELYLIVAEASYELGDEQTANDNLKTIRESRIRGYSYEPSNGTALRDNIRTERLRELIGEGFRMADLRRWGLGFTREASNYPNYPTVPKILTPAGPDVTYAPNDYRYAWPIPAGEIQTNPQMVGQQNPGYN